MPTDLRLNTTRLSLRPVCLADRADLVALEADAQVMRYLNSGLPVPEAGLPDADFLTPRGEESEVLAAHDRTSGAFIGWFTQFNNGLVDELRTGQRLWHGRGQSPD